MSSCIGDIYTSAAKRQSSSLPVWTTSGWGILVVGGEAQDDGLAVM